MKKLICGALLLLTASVVIAINVTVAWNHNTQYVTNPGSVFYRLYATTNTQTGSNFTYTTGIVIPVRGTNVGVVSNLAPGLRYSFAVTAMWETNQPGSGLESDYSDWVGLTMPSNPPAKPIGVRLVP